MMSKALIMLLTTLILLIGCAPTSGPAVTPPPSPQPSPSEGEGAERDPSQESENATTPAGQSVAPVVVDLGQLTPQPPADTTPRVMPAPGVPDPLAALTQKISLDLSGRLAIDVSEVELVSTEEVEWRDSSLGCPEPGVGYLTVMTPGYQITLQAQGELYDYHTDLKERFVLCVDGRPAKPE